MLKPVNFVIPLLKTQAFIKKKRKLHFYMFQIITNFSGQRTFSRKDFARQQDRNTGRHTERSQFGNKSKS